MNNDVDITILYTIWPKVVENVKMRRRLTWSLILTSAQILTLDDEVITIGMLNSLAIDSFIRTGSDLILSDAFEEVVGIRRKIKITKDLITVNLCESEQKYFCYKCEKEVK